MSPSSNSESGEAAARGDALRYLTYRARSVAEVRRRLSERHHPPDVVNNVIEWLADCGYVDDVKFANSWIESRTRTQPSGRLRLSRELRDKGVDEETIDAALAEWLPESRERELAHEAGAARRARYRGISVQVAKRRLGAFLMRRGFPSHIVYEVLRTVDMRDAMPD